MSGNMNSQFWTYVESQSILAAVGIAFVLFLRYRYRSTISRTARRQQYQYAMFALRDDVIRLVVESKVDEKDPQWSTLYRVVNGLSRTMTMRFVTSEFAPFYLFSLARQLSPSVIKDLSELKNAPKPVIEILAKTVVLLTVIVWDGSTLFRWCAKTLMRYSAIKNFVMKRKPELARVRELSTLSRSLDSSTTLACH